jgi:hypothetical protein
MNWRRGLFRLWIMGAVLFALTVTAISYTEIRGQFVRPALFVPVLCGDARGEPGTDYAIKEKGEPSSGDYTTPNSFETCWYALSRFRTFYPEYNDLKDGELIRKLHMALNIWTFDDLIAERIPQPWTTLGIWASIAFGVPLVVLILGASLAWALSGFSAKKP